MSVMNHRITTTITPHTASKTDCTKRSSIKIQKIPSPRVGANKQALYNCVFGLSMPASILLGATLPFKK